MKDCTTCKYGYEDERLDIPMCHHPKRFFEECVDFNMHEEKEIKESEEPDKSLEDAAEDLLCALVQGNESYDSIYEVHHAVEMVDELIKTLRDGKE